VIVVDASAVLEVLLRTRAGDRVMRRIWRPGERIHAPHLLDLEVLHVLRCLCTVGSLSLQRGSEALDDFLGFRVTRHSHQPLLSRIWELRHNFTAYDAAYIALAEALNVSVVTCDRALASSPGVFAKVEFIAVG
jgi:predicted nucleic acid-binding protein